MSEYLKGLLPTNGLEFDNSTAPHGEGKWGLFGYKENGPGISEPHELPDEYYEEVAQREELLEQLKIDEGVKYEIYLDHLGLATCGIGHLILETDPESKLEVGDEISEERVVELFQKDVGNACRDCVNLYGWSGFCEWPAEVQNICINMMFNMGFGRLQKFKKMHEGLESQDWETAAKEGRDSKWYKQVTNRAERLMSKLENI
tara:strand:+ start:1044 stop:1652 length:609 start_codon:yes stop_codon:yes gene_type:complete